MIPLPPKVIQKDKNRAIFEVEGLYPGYGVTIGNSLRRVLLSSLEGVAVTEVKIKGVPHEFYTIPGVLEDVIMIILNLKNLRFKIHEGTLQKVELKVKGEREVKGADFKFSPQVSLANPDLHIATLTDKNKEFEMEITIEKGIGYEPKEQKNTKKSEIGSIAIDAIFTPIKNVSFNVENMRVGERTDFDKLSFDVQTDGTITPEEAFYRACELLIRHFTVLFEGNIPPAPKPADQEAPADLEKTAVEDLKLSSKVQNTLLENNIKTVAGIVEQSEKALAEMEGMGDKAIAEIKKKLKKFGVELKAE